MPSTRTEGLRPSCCFAQLQLIHKTDIKRQDNKSGRSHPLLLQSRLCFWIRARHRQERANRSLEITAQTDSWQLGLLHKLKSSIGPPGSSAARSGPCLFLIYFALKHLAINSVLRITGSGIQPGPYPTPTGRVVSSSSQSGSC